MQSDDVIFSYSRANAIDDGVLVELPQDLCKEAGFVVASVAVTDTVWSVISTIPPGQDLTGRIWDVLNMLRFEIKQTRTNNGPELLFDVHLEGSEPTRLKCHSGPGDNGEHVLTIMLPHED